MVLGHAADRTFRDERRVNSTTGRTLTGTGRSETLRSRAMEEFDLSEADRKAIEAAERLASGTHWQVLGLHAEATSADVRRAYFDASKRFHPDRYFGKELGPYRARLEALFMRVKRAYDVLVDDEQRAQYAKAHPPPSRAKTAEEFAGDLDRERRLDARRKELAAARRVKVRQQIGAELKTLKLRRLSATARAALSDGDLVAASAAIDELAREAPNIKETLVVTAELLERQGKRLEALERYRAAQELDATDADVTKAIQRLAGPS